jgi:hypothetical protein
MYGYIIASYHMTEIMLYLINENELKINVLPNIGSNLISTTSDVGLWNLV